VLGGWEHAHVDADLGDQDLGGALLDARDRHQQVTVRRERAELLLDLGREPVDRLVEEVDVREDLPDDQRVLVGEAADQRLAQRRDLLAQLATCELCEHVRIGRAGHQRVEHRPA